jgi:hypothetical protein
VRHGAFYALNEEDALAQVEQMVLLEGGLSLSPADSAKVERAVALEIFKEYPVDTLKIHIKGAIRFLINPGLDTICAQVNRVDSVDGCYLGDSVDEGFIRKIVAKFAAMNLLQLLIALWSVFIMLMLYFGAVAGIYYLFREKQWLFLASLLLMILYFVALSAGGETTSRFRIPAVPFFALLAGIGWGKIQSFSLRKAENHLN